VRAREATRKDLMSARHRVSKLLLRQGIVYYGGRAWTGKHELWLRTQRFDVPRRQLAYDTVFDTMLATTDRRARLDTAIAQLAADARIGRIRARHEGLCPSAALIGSSKSTGGCPGSRRT
jgi:transposase